MNPAGEKRLEWTGERFVPEVTGNIRLEHLHRYLIARELSRDKRVLDIACGEGYGSNLLASVAANVVGVDVAQEAIDHAAARYSRPNLQFKCGACEAIPLPDRAVDVVVCFETIEHLSLHEAMMREVRRVLSADGLLVISNPERHEYSEILGNKNVYHVKELYREEFELLLRNHFLNIAIGGQRIQGGSIVAPLGKSTNTSFLTFPFSEDSIAGVSPIHGAVAPVYLLALASDIPLPEMPIGLLDGGEFVWASDCLALSSQARAQCAEELLRHLGDVVNRDGATVETVGAEFERQAERIASLENSLAAQAAQLQEATAKLAVEDLQLQEVTAKLAAEDLRLQEVTTKLAAEDLQLQEVTAKLAAEELQWREATSRLAAQEIELETQRRSSQDAHAQARTLQEALSDSRDEAARLAAEAQETIANLHSIIATHKTQVQTYERSRSWRMTAPLRAIRRRHGVSPPPSLEVDLSALRLRAASEEANARVKSAPTPAEPGQAAGSADANTLPAGFDHTAYLALNPDVAASGIDPALHYLNTGRHEGRTYLYELPDGFDRTAYLALHPDVAARGIDPALHYLNTGRHEGRAYLYELPDGFDRTAYLALHPDVAASGIDPALHYLRTGRHEGRAYSYELPGGFDHTAYLALHPDVAAKGIDPALHYLRTGRDEGRAYSYELPDGFDRTAYLALHPDVAAKGIDPALHYLRTGRHEGRAYSYDLPDGFDRTAYLALHPDVAASGVDPALHYLNTGRDEGRAYSYDLPDGFDRTAYLALHPDVAASGIDPVLHYLSTGRHEGRAYSIPGVELSGIGHIRADRDSILVVSHEASRTGAPMVTLNLTYNLVGRYNVVALLLGDGPLVDSFERAGAVTVVSELRRYPVLADPVVGQLQDQFRFRFALVNSIESRVVLRPLAARFVPVVSLVHEFAAYTRPRDAFPEAVLWSSDVVFSTNMTRQNMLQLAACSDARSVHTIPQGRCVALGEPGSDGELEKESERLRRWMRPEASGDDLVIVLGAGSVHLRKGVDLFIEVAARVASAPGTDNCRFIWLGNGYDPDGDAHYSAYLADQIERAGLEGRLFVAGETRAIETAYREADIFLMSSRLDPMPNVAVDALAHGKPVLCFDRATGIADFLKGCGLGDRCVARYLDTADMGDKIRTLAISKSLRQEVGEKGREASVSYFNMTDYVARLEDLARKAVERSRREEQDVELLMGSGMFRRDFAVPPDMAPLSLDAAVRLHVRSWASGIRRRKPFPGFHPGVYLETHGVAVEGSDPTADYIRAGMPNGRWNSTVISVGAGDVRDLPANESVALHMHVFYSDLLPDMMSRLSANRCRPDLLVSVTSEEARDLVARHLESYEGKVAALEVVPNRGRDIGPFLTQFGRRILSEYIYVGHIHTKKTEVVKDATLGKTWFEFLMANLLGSKSGAMADIILASMKADRSLGLVFPDDPHAQGWNANRGFAEGLASKMGIKELPQHFNFPVGTMFWARTSALSPLIDVNLQWDDYPEEPLPYDGTLLHAIERLLPLVLSEGTLRTATTNVTGVTR